MICLQNDRNLEGKRFTCMLPNVRDRSLAPIGSNGANQNRALHVQFCAQISFPCLQCHVLMFGRVHFNYFSVKCRPKPVYFEQG